LGVGLLLCLGFLFGAAVALHPNRTAARRLDLPRHSEGVPPVPVTRNWWRLPVIRKWWRRLDAPTVDPGDARHPRTRPLQVLSDTIQPFPSFSGIYDAALKELRMEIADMPPPHKPMDAQMANLSG
jgi:hypothetical protein